MRTAISFSYIDKLCGTDQGFRKRVLSVLKEEYPTELLAYKESLSHLNYRLAAEWIHKIKHKLALMDDQKAYHLAENYEKELVAGKDQSKEEMESILLAYEGLVEAIKL